MASHWLSCLARLVPLHQPRAIDRLIADGLVEPATTAKQSREHPAIESEGTVSDLVAEQRR